MTTNREDVTAIIRTVGERTKQACYELLSKQIPEENIIIINEIPFSAALVQSFKVGIEKSLSWTLCIDADVLIKQNAIEELLLVTEQLNENMFGVQGLIFCKFFGGFRGAGNRLYRTALLPLALDCIPSIETIRPESDTVRAMSEKGYPWKLLDVKIGLHDYEQYYKDIYRKCFIQAHKHDYYAQDFFIPLWTRLASSDLDYQVALWGLQDGKNFSQTIQINVEQFPSEINELLKMKGLKEKTNDLSSEIFNSLQTTNFLVNYIPYAEYIENYDKCLSAQLSNNPASWKQIIIQKFKSREILKLVYQFIQGILYKVKLVLEAKK